MRSSSRDGVHNLASRVDCRQFGSNHCLCSARKTGFRQGSWSRDKGSLVHLYVHAYDCPSSNLLKPHGRESPSWTLESQRAKSQALLLISARTDAFDCGVHSSVWDNPDSLCRSLIWIEDTDSADHRVQSARQSEGRDVPVCSCRRTANNALHAAKPETPLL